MTKRLYNGFLLVTGILFALSVLEIHGENSQNTFFDQDDTYIQSNNQNVELSAHFEKQNDFSKELNDFTATLFSLFSPDINVTPEPCPPKRFTCLAQKIFLRNSVWRI